MSINVMVRGGRRPSPAPSDAPVAKAIRRFRIRAGMSMKQLGGRVGVSHESISKYERGAMPRLDVAARIAKVLRIPLKRLLPKEFRKYPTVRTDVVPSGEEWCT